MTTSTDDYLTPLTNFLSVSSNETDRGKVLVATSQIDGMLEDILRAFLMDSVPTDQLFAGPNAPLSSLFNKANLAKSLGLIDDNEHQAISIMRKIRNDFAHSVHANFDNPRTSDQVANLTFGLKSLVDQSDPIIESPKTRFSMSAVSIISSLYNRAHFVSRQKRTASEWQI